MNTLKQFFEHDSIKSGGFTFYAVSTPTFIERTHSSSRLFGFGVFAKPHNNDTVTFRSNCNVLTLQSNQNGCYKPPKIYKMASRTNLTIFYSSINSDRL